MPNVKIIKLTFAPEAFKVSDIPRLRGFLARQFPEYKEIHNHEVDGRFRWVYPELQFKVFDNTPVIVGYKSGYEILVRLFEKVGYFEISHRRIEIPEKTIHVFEEEIGVCNRRLTYEFLTPWMALNKQNYEKTRQLDWQERQKFLSHLLRENLKTVSHAFDYWIPDPDAVHVEGRFHPLKNTFKGKTMLTYKGIFKVNFMIPDYLGLGKQVARGFGTVKKLWNE